MGSLSQSHGPRSASCRTGSQNNVPELHLTTKGSVSDFYPSLVSWTQLSSGENYGEILIVKDVDQISPHNFSLGNLHL